MFSKADKTRTSSRAAAGERVTPSLISSDLKIVGNLKSDGEMQIDGNVEGDIDCGKLTIGEKATIKGEIVAGEVVVRGRVDGRIRGGSVQLARTARVIGDVLHETLSIEAGAFLEGHCQRREDTPAKPAATGAAARPATTDKAITDKAGTAAATPLPQRPAVAG
ncbi:MAG TPA: polymer-forming cytoskeletal protein [Alphaproteobacteria bacterium]|nr:polymer-forming cytoskeletal protein [Alphaproteobacteria bacterium]